MINKTARNFLRKRRHARFRERVLGSAQKPRLSVFRSEKHIYAQLIDDLAGNTLVQVNSLQEDLKEELKEKSPKEKAELLGGRLARLALEKKIESVVFDRAGYKYHGRIAALAEGARKEGLKF